MRRGRTPLALLVACLGLFGYIWFVERGRDVSEDGTEKKPPVFGSLEADDIDEMTVTSSAGSTTTLKKDGGTWQITSPVAARTDAAEVSGLTTNLATLSQQRVVDEAPGDLAPFGLKAPRVQIAFRTTGSTTMRTLQLGEKTATGGDLYAKTADSPRVFLVSAFLDTTFDRSTFDLRDKTVVLFDREKVDRLEITRGAERVVIVKSGAQWAITAPGAARADASIVESFIGRIHTGTMKSIETETAADLASYGLDTPEVVVTLGAGSSTAAFALGGRATDGSVYARDPARTMVFTVDATMADDLRKKADDFRPRDVFEFRTFTATRVEIERHGATVTFEKQKGSEPNAESRWTQTSPKKEVASDTIGDALSSLSNLRADSFLPALPTGAAPLASATARFGDGKIERVQLFKAGDDYIALRAGDAGAMKLTTSEAEAAMKTLDGLK